MISDGLDGCVGRDVLYDVWVELGFWLWDGGDDYVSWIGVVGSVIAVDPCCDNGVPARVWVGWDGA